MANKEKANPILIVLVVVAAIAMVVVIGTLVLMLTLKADVSNDSEYPRPLIEYADEPEREMNARPDSRLPLNEEDPAGLKFKEVVPTLVSSSDPFHLMLKRNVSEYVQSIETDFVIAQNYAEQLAVQYASGELLKNIRSEEDYAMLYFKLDYISYDAIYGGLDSEYADFSLALTRLVKAHKKNEALTEKEQLELQDATLFVLQSMQ